MPPKYQAPRGTQDVLPEVSWRWQRVEAAFRDICRRYHYREIRTPLFEETELFERGTGEGTEIVTKQMYTFQDRAGRSLTLRPEGTPPVVRAYLEHNLGAQGGTQKLYYLAPIFRYERPQAGRYRQHTQLGLEAIGAPGPDIDAEVIALYHDFLQDIGLAGAVTHISSIGDANCRPAFSAALREFFAPKIAEMCEFCRARYDTNPLRLLDCKVPHDVAAREGAPSALDHLCHDCRAHFDGVRAMLDALGIPYEVDPTIVRGLDYYTRTTFEVVHPALGAKDVIMGGGRYDGLVEALGGPPTPGIGFGSGLERLLLVLTAATPSPALERGQGGEASKTPSPFTGRGQEGGVAVGQERACPERSRGVSCPGPDVYLASASPAARQPAFLLAIELRRAGLSAELDYIHRSLKAQMRDAARLGAPFAILIGEDELAAATVTLRDMVTGDQTTVPWSEAIHEVKQKLGSEDQKLGFRQGPFPNPQPPAPNP
jgi:histidyl-tRNA synthetase